MSIQEVVQQMRDEANALRQIVGGMVEEIHNQYMADKLDFFADKLDEEIKDLTMEHKEQDE